LTSPRTLRGAASTVALTAAWAGVSRNASWKAPTRSSARVEVSSWSSTNRSTNQSHARRMRVVP
jgi:hypothetical protein